MKYDYNITQNDFLLWSDKYRKYKNNKKLMFLAMKLSILMVISIFIILFAQFKIKYRGLKLNISSLILFIICIVVLTIYTYILLNKFNKKDYNLIYILYNEKKSMNKYINNTYGIFLDKDILKITDSNSFYKATKQDIECIIIDNDFITIMFKNFRDIFIPLQNKDSKEISEAICNVYCFIFKYIANSLTYFF